MKLIFALEIILVIFKNAWSSTCSLPHGLHVYELGIVYTLTCPELRLGIYFDKQMGNFTKSKSFYRAICDENGDIILVSPKLDGMVFCADRNCFLPDSTKLSSNFSQHFNGSVITTTDKSEIFYCIESKWYSLFKTILPKDLETVNNIEPNDTSHKAWIEVNTGLKLGSTIVPSNSKPEYIFPSLHEKHFTNYSDIKILKLQKGMNSNIDLCGIAIICSVVCSFFFFIAIILILSSRFLQEHQIRRRFLEPNSVVIDSKVATEDKSANTNHKVEISYILIPNESGNSSRETEYTSPSKSVKNIEDDIP